MTPDSVFLKKLLRPTGSIKIVAVLVQKATSIQKVNFRSGSTGRDHYIFLRNAVPYRQHRCEQRIIEIGTDCAYFTGGSHIHT
ncbi:hypothetical protein SDC9_212331 [bioreactor metagenome]|uniref:Uncharacterized protein n=1 Tax=bioreactor metagenome TaxID=1076179 RepID=A0A645JMD4_9ZZZZ